MTQDHTQVIEKSDKGRSRIIFMPKRQTVLRITIAVVLLILAMYGLTVYLVFTATKNEIRNQLIRRVRDAAVIAAMQVENSKVAWDYSKYRKTQRYRTLYRNLYDLSESMGLENLYMMDKDMKAMLTVRGPQVETAEDLVRLLDEDFQRVFDGEILVSDFYPDKKRFFVTAYAPVLNKKTGKSEYIIGADLDVSSLQTLQVQNLVKNNIPVILGATIVASLIVAVIISLKIVSPVKKMVNAAEEIGLGRFDVKVPIRSRDELGFLGQTINDMAEDIRKRDQKISELTRGIIEDLQLYNQLILEGMFHGVVTFDLEGRIETINPAAEKILGVQTEEYLGEHFTAIMTIKGPLQKKVLVALRQDDKFNDFEAKLNIDEEEKLVTCDFAPLIDHYGEKIGHTLFLEDVTEIRRLERKVKLKEKMAAIGELSAGIAHEIRNPLNSIELFLGLLQRKLGGAEDSTNLVDKVRLEISKLNSILSDFLKFARPVPLDLAKEDLRDVIHESLFFAQGELEKQEVRYELTFPDYVVNVDIDRQQIKQSFINIILNAAQAMGEAGSGGMLKISAAPGENGFYQAIFEDNGPGIPADIINRIYDPFFTTKDAGTGLGLAMVHKIVETHGGAIDVKSSRAGTTFTISLPKSGGLYSARVKGV